METKSARTRKRSIWLYHNVLSSPDRGGAPLVIVRVPDTYVKWSELRQQMFVFMRRDFGIKVKDIFAIEGLAGAPAGDNVDERWDPPEYREKLEKAFNGSPDHLKAFHLYDWDPTLNGFKLARSAVDNPS